MNDTIIHKVLHEKLIVDYLEKKGHHPVKQLNGGKLSYFCPFPDHSETKPSFIVWTNAEFQNFRCFGCQRCYHIIHLVSGLEGISFKAALEKLSGGMEVSLTEDIAVLDMQIKKVYDSWSQGMDLSESLMSISSLCRSYLDGMGNDEHEQCIIDKLLFLVDDDLANFNFDGIEETLRFLPELLVLRSEKLIAEKNENN